VRVEGGQALARDVDLRPPDVARFVEDLSLEVRDVDRVEVGEADPPDARRGEVEPRPPAPTTRTLPALSRDWPAADTSGNSRWREYRAISSRERGSDIARNLTRPAATRATIGAVARVEGAR
jgi:hypothetical protein